MKPSEIYKVMTLAENARKQGRVFNPLFVSPPGLGKSAIVQDWAKKNGYGLIDIRAALREAPDLIGFPRVVFKDGKEKTINATPEMWPDEGKHVVFIDEVNRGTQSVMNAFMQLLTDRAIGNHKLPPDVIIVSAINPEDEQNDVNTMDSALKDRFEFFHVEYDRKEHVAYMRSANYTKQLIDWVEQGVFKYRRPENVGDVAGDKYLSPRSLEKLDTAIKAGLEDLGQDFELMVYNNILGQLQGASFYQFKYNDRPITYAEIKNKKTRKSSLERLARLSDPTDYKAGSVSMTVQSIIDDGTIEDDLLVEVILALPADQGPDLLYKLEAKRKDTKNELSNRIVKENKSVYDYFNQTFGSKAK